MKDLIKVFILITLILMIAGIISAIYFNEPVVLIVFGFFWFISAIIIYAFLED